MPTVDHTPQQTHLAEATVIVWRNITKLGFIPTGHFGHAAIMLRDPSTGFGTSTYKYISWWPESAGKEDAFKQQDGISESNFASDMRDEMSDRARDALLDGTYNPRPGQVVLERDGTTNDPTDYGAKPEAIVPIPGVMGHPDNGLPPKYGLHVGRMWQWFKGYRRNNGTYQLASKTQSCSGVSLVALIEGGGEAFASAPKNLIYSKPNQVEEYADKLVPKIDRFNRDMLWLQRNAVAELRKGSISKLHFEGDLWTVQRWKEISAIKGRPRSLKLKKVDSKLRKFHAHSWAQFKDKYRALIEMLRAIHDHRVGNLDSKRAFALSSLALAAMEIDVLAKANLPLQV